MQSKANKTIVHLLPVGL